MAAAVLGKRSRKVLDTEDLLSELPPPKRRTRHTAPLIHEDEEDGQPTCAVDQSYGSNRATLRSSRSKRSRTVQAVNKNKQQAIYSTQHMNTSETFADSENIPPSILATPTTIRHIDYFDLKNPSTPRHRVRLAGSYLTPRSLQKSQYKTRPENVFSKARQLFTQSSNSARLIGRDAERQQLRKFISCAITSRNGGCTYVSGPPGTGKSALVQEVYNEFNDEQVEKSIINCVSLRTANDVFGKLVEDFSPDKNIAKLNFKQHLSKLFLTKSTGRLRLILLDEIDNLLDSDCEILHTIFEWAMHKQSNIILVGIANALDLTDRFLPRLRARGLKPILLPFLPYTATQISTIISDKLRSLISQDANVAKDFTPLMQPAAIQLCGKKVASQTGDLRKAFSLVRRIIDQVEIESTSNSKMSSPSKTPLKEIANVTNQSQASVLSVSQPRCEPNLIFTPETAPRASIAHAAKLASTIFNNGTLSRLSGLNLQQKAVLCSLVAGEKRKAERNPYITPSKSTNKVPSVKELFVKYSMLCKRDEGLLQPLKDTEFRDVVSSLETLGLVHEHRGRNSSLSTPTSTPSRTGRNDDGKQIVSAVSEKEMRESLCGAGADLLRRLLEED